jgi:hypothetical protein
VVSETVATPIEQQVNGAENMLYMSSPSTSDGMVLSITLTRHQSGYGTGLGAKSRRDCDPSSARSAAS